MTFKWANNSISIVLLPLESRYSQVHVQLKQWIADSLLGPFILLTAEDIVREPFGPPKVLGTVWGLNEDRELTGIEVDVFEELAKNRFKIVRLLAVRVLSNNFEVNQEEHQKFDLLSDNIRHSLPLAMGQDIPGEKTNLKRINLVIFPTELVNLENSSVFKGQWDYHVIASPEDRRTPLSADRFVKEDVRFPKFIAMHAAATAGLWNGIAHSPFDDLVKPESGAQSYQLSRVFVNAVLTDGLSRRVAASVLSNVADPNVNLFDRGLVAEISNTHFIEESDVETVIDEMVDIVFDLENEILRFKSPDANTELQKNRWKEWKVVSDFLKFAGLRFLLMPKWCWIWIRRKIGNKLQATLVGSDGDILVGIDQDDAQDIRDKQLFEKIQTINSNMDEAQKALIAPFRKTSTTSRPTLWSEIRQLVFGFLEGGDLNKFGIQDVNGSYPMIPKVQDLIQDPKEKWTFGSELAPLNKVNEINWSNLGDAHKLQDFQNRHINTRKTELDLMLGRIVEIDRELSELQGEQL